MYVCMYLCKRMYIWYVCSLSRPTCNAHAPYCYLWPVRLYNIFPRYLINCMIFGKKRAIEHKICILILFTILSRTFLFLSMMQQCIIRYGHKSDVYRGADKSLARPGRKEARKHVRDERDFNNIETRAAINFFFCKARRRR